MIDHIKRNWIIYLVGLLVIFGAWYGKLHTRLLSQVVGSAYAEGIGKPPRAAVADTTSGAPSWSGVYGAVQTGIAAVVADPILGVDGYFYGGRAGADLQINRIVIGALAEYNWAHFTAFSTDVDATQWMIGGRAGILATTHTLIYGVVGRSELDVDGLGKTQGISFGGGIETMLHPNWTLGVEYLRTAWDDIGGDAREHAVGVRLGYRFAVPAFRP